MSKLEIVFKNYKAIKEKEFNLENGTIFMFQGANEAGKTSVLNMIKSIMEVKDDTINPVTYNEKEGFVYGSILGADNKHYTFRYDFNVDGKRKFIFFDEDNRPIKTVKEMRAIFNYIHFTADDFFNWSKTAEGRRKQRDIILNLLTEEEKSNIAQIDDEINNLYSYRTTLNKTIDNNNILLNEYSKKEFGDFDKLELYEQDLNELNKVREDSISLSSEYNNIKFLIDKANINYNNDINRYYENLKTLDNNIKNRNNRIEQLKLEILKLEEENVIELNKQNEIKSDMSNKVNKYKEQINEYNNKLNLLENNPNYRDIKVLDEQINNLKMLIYNLNVHKKEYEEYINLLDKSDNLKIKQAELNEKIEYYRQSKKDIIKNSPHIPSGIEIDDDYIIVDGIPFVDTDISLSRAIKTIAKIMIKINKAPVMIMGDAEMLGYKSLNELEKLAIENNKIMIFAEHVRDKDELTLVCYDRTEEI